MGDSAARWPAAWVRASLDIALLSTLREEPLHGYAIAVSLEQAGLGRLKGGSLYPALARLEQAGLVEAVWVPGEAGPARKAYTLTHAGHQERERLVSSWQELSAALQSLGTPSQEGARR